MLQWLPIGSLGKKASLWSILGAPGVWWIDLQIDGVKKGCVSYVKVDMLGKVLIMCLQLSRQTPQGTTAAARLHYRLFLYLAA